jgi:hypothetical protein
VAAAFLFEEKEKATSLRTLVRKVNLTVADKLNREIQARTVSIRRIESIRQQVCAHRCQAKVPQDVFAEVKLTPFISSFSPFASVGFPKRSSVPEGQKYFAICRGAARESVNLSAHEHTH